MIYGIKKVQPLPMAWHFSLSINQTHFVLKINNISYVGRISCWIVTQLKFDFNIIVQDWKDNVLTDHFDRPKIGEDPLGLTTKLNM